MKPVSFRALIELHGRTITIHGGLPGIRDEGLVRSAIERPVNVAHYHPGASVGTLAAAVCVGIAKGHGFNDGNKRAAFIALNIQLGILGYMLVCTQQEAFKVILDVASGVMSEPQLAAWVDAHIVPEGST
ncbi:MAG: type II toxin-antitoxin system death-on-curing family toxin [Allorhizobium sp.]